MPLRGRGEQGSMIIALTVMLVVAGLAVAVLSRTTSSLTSSKRSQDFNSALGAADAGVSDALFRLDQLAGSTPSSFCVGASTCTVTSLPTDIDVQYTVTPSTTDPAAEVTIRSKGRANDVPHGVEVIARSSYRFPFAIFGKTSLTFNGNGDNNTIRTVDANGNSTSRPASAGSNGSLDCNGGGSSPADTHAAQGSNNCNPQLEFSEEYNPLDPVLDCSTANTTNAPPQPCPETPPTNCASIPGIVVDESQVTLPTSMVGGRYQCDRTVKFPESSFTVTSGVVELFIVSTSGTPNLDFTKSIVNGGAAATSDPTKLFVYMAGSGSVLTGNGGNAGEFTGVLYAPSATLTENGCKAKWRGAIVVNEATCNGGPNQSIQYDERIANITDGRWKVKHFRQIPSSQVVLP